MKNIKTFEGFLDFFKSKKEEEILSPDNDHDEIERRELEEKTLRSISLAQRNGSPTYYNHVTKSTEVTPSISTRKQSLSNIRKGMK